MPSLPEPDFLSELPKYAAGYDVAIAPIVSTAKAGRGDSEEMG